LGIGKSMASKNEVQAAKQRQAKPEEPIHEIDPWALEAPPVEDIGGAPQCQHGVMTRKIGTNKQGQPYGGWVCGSGGNGENCAAKWDRS